MDPSRRARLDGTEQVGQRDRRLQPYQQMQVVRHAPDRQQGAAFVADDPCHVGIQIVPQPWTDESRSISGAEDDVVQELSENMGHWRDRLLGGPPRSRDIPRGSTLIKRKKWLP